MSPAPHPAPECWRSLGAAVEVSGLSAELRATLREFWEDAPGGAAPAPEGRVLTVRAGDLPPLPSQARALHLRLIEAEVTVWQAGNEVWVPGFLHLRVWAGGATLTGCARTTALPPEWPEVWSLALTEAHRAGGWLPLHAALIAQEGRAVAVSGVSGAGKSTAALRLLGEGFSVLAEDRAFWQPASGRVAGFDRGLRAFADSVERFAPGRLPAALAGPRDAKGKLHLALAPPPQAATLVGALLLRGEAQPGETLSSPGRVRAVWEMTGVPLTLLAREQVQAGVGRLWPLLAPEAVGREDVLERVRTLLGSGTRPGTAGG